MLMRVRRFPFDGSDFSHRGSSGRQSLSRRIRGSGFERPLRGVVKRFLLMLNCEMARATEAEMELCCDGCGQMGSPEHIARRLRRLEWATRYRPVHIQTLLLAGIAPGEDAEFLYAPGGEFHGEAELLLRAVG